MHADAPRGRRLQEAAADMTLSPAARHPVQHLMLCISAQGGSYDDHACWERSVLRTGFKCIGMQVLLPKYVQYAKL
jgi:hypothetical protein